MALEDTNTGVLAGSGLHARINRRLLTGAHTFRSNLVQDMLVSTL